MNAPAAHNALQEQQVGCVTCGALFSPARRWAKFCSSRCRMAFHGSIARIEKINARGMVMYYTLVQLAKVEGPVGEIAKVAIHGLKPPVEPKDLLKERPGP